MLNAKGAAKRIDCSPEWVQKLVSKGQLRAYCFVNDVLAEHVPGSAQGMTLLFYEEDVDAFQRRPRGRRATATDVPKPPKKANGRPRKPIDTTEPRRPVGRPKKAVDANETKRPVGRPRKSDAVQ